MKTIINVVVCSIALGIPAAALAETPAEIFQEMNDRKRASLAGISEFSQMKSTMNMCTLEHFEQTTAGDVQYFRLVPMPEVMERISPDNAMSNATPEDLEFAAAELRSQAPRIDGKIREEMREAGIPPGLGEMFTTPPPDQPWLSPMPGDMMSNYAMMLEATAEAKRAQETERERADQEAQQDPMANIAAQTRIVGNETINGRPAIHLVAENLNQTQVADGQEFVLDTMHLWVDAEKYVSLKMRMDGTATSGGESRDMRIEREDTAYYTPDGCAPMYEPQRSVMRVSGVMTPEEESQLLEAQAQLEEMKTQLASLPQTQQDMIMRQMGPQIEMLEKMAAGEGIEVVSYVTGMRCNAGLPTKKEYMQTVPGVSMAACIGFVDD